MNDKTILLAQSDPDEVLTLRVLEKAGPKNRLVMTRDGIEARLTVLEDWCRRTTYVLRGRIVIGEHDDQAINHARKEGGQANGEDQ